MVIFCDILHESKQKTKTKTLESAQHGLEISFNNQGYNISSLPCDE